MIDKVQTYIKKHNMIQKRDRIILGISGGADSVCLLFVLLELKKIYEIEIIGVHVNHNIRGADALHDQEFVRQLCERYEIPCEIVNVNVLEEANNRNQSVEEAGRDIRREAFLDVKQRYHADKIALAHHSNDNVETFLMNLARGTGLGGLKGIEPKRGAWIRPLLCVERGEVENYLIKKKELFCTDYTNMENIYTRNMIRNQVIPILESSVNDKTVSHMNQAIEEVRKVEEYIGQQVEAVWRLCTVEKEDGGIMIHKQRLLTYPLVLRERVVKKGIEFVAMKQKDITRRNIVDVCKLLERQNGKIITLPYGLIAKRVYDGIEIYKCVDTVESDVVVQDVVLNIPGETLLPTGELVVATLVKREKCTIIKESLYTKQFDYDIIKSNLTIRRRHAGDFLVIHTNGNKQLLKKYLVNKKIPQEERGKLWNLAVDNQVLWVLGYRRSESYKVTEETNVILEIQMKERVGGKQNGNS